MNKLLTRLAPALGAAALSMLACNAPARADSVDAEMMHMQHEAQLRPGEKLMVAYHMHKESTVRFCIPEQPGDIRLKVLHDGATTEVVDGTCETITGRHIDLMADSKIPRGDALQLKFEKVKAT